MQTWAKKDFGWSAVIGLILTMGLLAGCKTDSLTATEQREDENAFYASIENPVGVELPNIRVVNREEVDLVEDMVLHRAMYAKHLRVLVTYYTDKGYIEKARWAKSELNDLMKVKGYAYIMDAEVPAAGLRPTESIAEADAMYEQGIVLMKKGGHGVPALFHQETMKRALTRLKELVSRYPSSDKIDDAAFYIAEMHKEYFEENDNGIALEWYRRSIQWNPNLPHPARFQMAVVYDYRLHEREKALEMYQQVLEKEQFNKSNIEWSNVRIRQLTAERTRHAAGDSIPYHRSAPIGSEAPVSEEEVAGPLPTEVP